ncbi:MAG: SDR family oxidoreductase [Bacteroidota bacterium]
MTRILITGSNGLLGRKLVNILSGMPEIELTATSRSENKNKETSAYRFERMDITNIMHVKTILEKANPDIIIHTAAESRPDFCEENPVKCWSANVDAVKTLLDSAGLVKAHFIHLSTDFVFDGFHGPYNEEALPSPVSLYGNSKQESENLVMKYQYGWTIIRTILVYGVLPVMARSNIIIRTIENLKQGQEIKAVDDQYRMPTLAEDLADACIAAALKKATGIYHISGNDMMSIYELCSKTAKFFGFDSKLIRPVPTISLNEKARRPARTGFIIQKAQKELDYMPVSFNRGLEIIMDQINIISSNGGTISYYS